MKKLPILMFLFIMASAFCSSMCSYRSASDRIETDINNALELTLAEMQCDVVSADTIRCYRNYLTNTVCEDCEVIFLRLLVLPYRSLYPIQASDRCLRRAT